MLNNYNFKSYTMKKDEFIAGKNYKIQDEILCFMFYDVNGHLCFEPKTETKWVTDEDEDGVLTIRFFADLSDKFTEVEKFTLSDTKQLLISEVKKALKEQDFLFLLELQNLFEQLTVKN